MQYNISVNVESKEQAVNILEALDNLGGVPVTAEKPKKKKQSKKKAKATKEPEDDLGFDAEESEEIEQPTIDDVRMAFKKYVKSFGDVKKGMKGAKRVLKKFKAESTDDLDEDDYATVIETLEG